MNARKLFLTFTIVLAIFLAPLTRAAAQGTTINVQNLPAGQSLTLVLQMDPKAGSVSASVPSNGPVADSSIAALLSPDKPQVQLRAWYCKNADGSVTVHFLPLDAKDPCPGRSRELGAFWLGGGKRRTITIDAATGAVTVSEEAASTPAPSSAAAAGATSAFPIDLQLEGFGGVAWPNGVAAPKYGGGFGLMFPFASRFAAGFMVYAAHQQQATVQTFGNPGGGSGSTSEAVKFNATGLFVGPRAQISITNRFSVDPEAGLFASWAKINQIVTVCGPTGCSTFPGSMGVQHPRNLGWSAGAGGSFHLNNRVSVFVRYNRDQFGAGGKLDGLNDLAFGVRLTALHLQ